MVSQNRNLQPVIVPETLALQFINPVDVPGVGEGEVAFVVGVGVGGAADGVGLGVEAEGLGVGVEGSVGTGASVAGIPQEAPLWQ